jgi:hypothetical protein
MAACAPAEHRLLSVQLPSDRGERWLLWAPFAVVVALVWCNTPDDPLITLRYAANVVHGFGPVFNAGQRVEGFTSPLHLIVDVGIMLLPGGLKLFEAKLVSLLFAALAVRQGGRFIAMAGLPRWATELALVLTGGSWVIGFASGNGLETSLACWLTTLLLCRLASGEAVSRWRQTAVIAALCVLARPDALAVVAALSMASVLVLRRVSWADLRWVTGGLVGTAVVEGARLAYYGSPVPNTYIAKRVSASTAAKNGAHYLVQAMLPDAGRRAGPMSMLSDVLVIVPFVALAVGAMAVLRGATPRSMKYAVAAVAAQTAFVMWAGGDWIHGARFLAPVVPALVVIEVVGVAALVEELATDRSNAGAFRRAAVTTMVGLAALPLATHNAPAWSSRGRMDTISLIAAGGYGAMTDVWVAGDHLLACAPPGSLVAYSEIGLSGFTHLNLRFLDQRGLVDPEIAKATPTSMRLEWGVQDDEWTSPTSAVGRAIIDRQPALILTLDGLPWSSAFGDRYRDIWHHRFGTGWMTLYRRSDVPCTVG